MASTPLNRYWTCTNCDARILIQSLPHLMMTYYIFLGQLQYIQCRWHVWQSGYWLWLHRPWHNSPSHDGRVRNDTKLDSTSLLGKWDTQNCRIIISSFIDFQSRFNFCQIPMPMTTVHSTHSSLIPGTTYYYMFGDSGPGGSWSQEFSFTAPPPVGPSATTRVVAFGGESCQCTVSILHLVSLKYHGWALV